MFPVKHTVIYTFFAITSVQNTCFCSVFNALASKKPCKILLCTMFFSFLAVFPLPENYQNDPKFHFNTLLRSDTQKSSKNVENTTVFWSRCETVFGPPPRDGLLGTMRQKAFNRNDLEREKKHSSSGYSSSSIITCCYALALHLYLSTHLLLWIKFLPPRSQ